MLKENFVKELLLLLQKYSITKVVESEIYDNEDSYQGSSYSIQGETFNFGFDDLEYDAITNDIDFNP